MTNFSLRNTLYSGCPRTLRLFWDRVEASPIGFRLAHSAFWSMSGAVISSGLMLLAYILVARVLGRDVYGQFGIIRSTVSMFIVFAGFGLGMTATKHVAEFRETEPVRAGRIMALSGLFALVTGLLMATGLLIFAPYLASQSINAPHLVGELRIGSIILFISALNGAQTGALAGFEAFKTIARINLSVGLFSFPLLICGAYFGNLRGAVCALAVNMAINWLLNRLALTKETTRHHVPITFKGCIQEWPILWKFSLPAALSGIMVGPVIWMCNAILVNQPGGFGQMGIFDAANQWRATILFVPSMVGQIVLPMLSNLSGLNDRTNYRKILEMNILINSGAALVVALPIALSAYWIMRIYGPGFEQGPWVLVCLAFSSVLISVNNVVGQAIASRGRMWTGLLFNAFWAVALLASSLILIRQDFGAMGLALANLIAYLLHSLWQSIYAIKLLR